VATPAFSKEVTLLWRFRMRTTMVSGDAFCPVWCLLVSKDRSRRRATTLVSRVRTLWSRKVREA
jgi:hypothetical protein